MASGFDLNVNWGTQNVVSRHGGTQDSAFAGQAEAASVPPGYLARVLAAFAPRSAVSRPPMGARAAVPGLAEPLTQREMEVLRLLDAGRSNQFISHDLTVTLDTTKKHVSHILAKLGAASRGEAVARARELRLIP